MFSTEQERTRDHPRSWYGKPQHETDGGRCFEFRRYGSPTHEQPREPIEFLPVVEWPVDTDGFPKKTVDDGTERIRPSRAGD